MGSMDTLTIIAIVIAVIALIVAIWSIAQVQRTRRLKSRFGPEYDYELQREGDRRRAEAELAGREARADKLEIRHLTKDERQRFAQAWKQEQAHFVDDPPAAVSEADHLVNDVMAARGYPTTAEVSADHANVMGNYREAHEIAERNSRGQAGTEDLRRAMICYRALFDDLLEANDSTRTRQEIRR